MTSQSIQASYQLIWDKYNSSTFKPILDRGFVFQYDEDETDCELLYVGINPSYTEKHEKGKDVRSLYRRSTARAYFNVFGHIHNQLRETLTIDQYTNWTHLDLFVHRETNQKKIEKGMKDSIEKEFLWEQLQIAKKRLIHISPKVIIISNALAREFLGKNRGFDKKGIEQGIWMGLNFGEMDEEYGSFKVKNIPELAHTHFLFSSMLSGQRALDIGSRERLVWQVCRILKNSK